MTGQIKMTLLILNTV